MNGHCWETAQGHTARAATGPGPEHGPAYGLSPGLPRMAVLCLPPALSDVLLNALLSPFLNLARVPVIKLNGSFSMWVLRNIL